MSDPCDLEQQLRELDTKIAKIGSLCKHLRFLQRIRSPEVLGPYGVMVVASAVVLAVVAVATDRLTGSFSTVAIASPLAAVLTVAALAKPMLSPSTETLEAQLVQLESHLRILRQDREKKAKLVASSEYKQEQQRRRQEQQRQQQQQRQDAFLAEDWRAMRGVPFELYLKAVCESLGYKVETTPVTGDMGADLILIKNGVRCAVQAKGYRKSVGSKAVQEAYTGQRCHNCDTCAVITNAPLTRSAERMAVSTGCILVSERNFQYFVRGAISFTEARQGR